MIRATRRRLILNALPIYGAEEGTRTPTPLRVRGPEPRASANSATSALDTGPANITEHGSNSESRKCRLPCQIPCAVVWRLGGRDVVSRPAGASLHEFGVEQDLGVVGKELGDGAAGLGICRGLVKNLFRSAGDFGCGGDRKSGG